jgi:integrase
MVKIRLPYVNAFRNKARPDGRVRYYFRRGRSGRAILLPGAPGSEEFMAAYGAALASMPNAPTDIGAGRTMPGTINALVANYYRSAAWLDDISEETRRRRKFVVERFRELHGDKRVAFLRRDHFQALLGEIPTPAAKVNWLKAIRALMKSGVPTLLKADPTAGLTVKGGAKSKPHHMWLDSEIEQYRAHWPLGTMQRLVLEFALETMSRRGEVVRLGPQHLYRKNDQWRIRIARIKGSNPVDIPVSDTLFAACQAMPKTGLAYVTGRRGEPLDKHTLGIYFARWCDAAGLPRHCRMHGLKRSGMSRLALAGVTAPELLATSGHKSLVQAQRYIEEVVNRPELADRAFEKLQEQTGGTAHKRAAPAYTNTAKKPA